MGLVRGPGRLSTRVRHPHSPWPLDGGEAGPRAGEEGTHFTEFGVVLGISSTEHAFLPLVQGMLLAIFDGEDAGFGAQEVW